MLLLRRGRRDSERMRVGKRKQNSMSLRLSQKEASMTQNLLFDRSGELTHAPIVPLPPVTIPPIDPHVDRRDVPRLSRQCALIVERLRRGPATNDELSAIARKYTSRISDIRAAGFEIPEPTRLGGGLTRYTLTREP